MLSAAVLALVSGCARAAVDTVPPGPVVLAAITWNMNAGRGDLPRLVRDLRAGRLTRVPVPHFVLLLQELIQIDGQFPALAGEESLSSHFAPIRVNGARISGNAIVSTLPLLEPRTIPLPQERQPRGAVAASIDVEGVRIFVASAHLENRVSWARGGLMSDSARARQAEALLGALPASAPGILGGDFNIWLGVNEPAWRALLRRFDDTPPGRPPATFRDRLALDHVFFDLPDGWRAVRWVAPDRYRSDHHPVVSLVVRPT